VDFDCAVPVKVPKRQTLYATTQGRKEFSVTIVVRTKKEATDAQNGTVVIDDHGETESYDLYKDFMSNKKKFLDNLLEEPVEHKTKFKQHGLLLYHTIQNY
jgi:ligand-binding sensor protein